MLVLDHVNGHVTEKVKTFLIVIKTPI